MVHCPHARNADLSATGIEGQCSVIIVAIRLDRLVEKLVPRRSHSARTCPKCGTPMRLAEVPSGEPRVWECTNKGWSVSDPCYYTESIPGDVTLSILDIAGSFSAAGGFTTSDEFKKSQANVRRILGGLRKLRLDAYLSDGERQAVADAIIVLGRIGDSFEKAKNLKKAEEKAEMERRDKRYRKAQAELNARYRSQDIPTIIIHSIAISNNLLCSYSTEAVSLDTLTEIQQDTARWPREKPYTYAINQIRDGFDGCLRLLATDIGSDRQPIDELLENVVTGIDASIQELSNRSGQPLDQFSQWLIKQKIVEANTPRSELR